MKVALILLAVFLAGCATQRGFPPEHQIVNFDVVQGDKTVAETTTTKALLRGGQPNHASIRWLFKIGVTNIVNLTQDPMGVEATLCSEYGINYTNIPLSGLHVPSKQTVDMVLGIIDNIDSGVFVHCTHGCDRTGLIVACWRIKHGWVPEKAIVEADQHAISPLLPNFKSFIRHYSP